MKKFVFLCLFLLLAAPCLAEMISVVHQPAELRDRPMVAGSKILRKLPRYTPLTLLGSELEYYKVKDINGTVGFLHKSLTQKSNSLVITGDLCNVRSGPGRKYEVNFKTSKGKNFRVLENQGDWVKIVDTKGNSGWIHKDLTWGYE